MRMVFGLVLVVGLALAGFAVYMAQGYMADLQNQRDMLLKAQEQAPQLVDVVVAKKALKYGERFTRDDLDVVKWQADKVPEGAFHVIVDKQGGDPAKPPVFFDGETRPRAVLRSVEVYEPILLKKITDPGVDAGINANLTPGMRALALNVDVSTGVSGFLRPGDKVDVYWSGNANGKDVTKLIQASVRLIAIDQSADADRTDQTQLARTVTVEVSPEQVAALALAQNSGRLTLSLVGTGDTVAVGAVEIDRNKLLGISDAPAPAPAAAAPKVCTIKTNKGGQIVETPIACTN
jgi:pilus assembly protein CpaB